uniref:Dynein regulatory complex subunit 4 n=1 Tax=Stegastes partitus TaxID=144197 RepID=A0A3B5AXG0_9TELE
LHGENMETPRRKIPGVSSVEPCCTLHHSSVSVLQLEEHIIRLREELDREREERSFFQLERDKTQALWDISKRNLEETKAELRNRHREKEEAEERHRVEITVYKQKLKHVLSEHHNTTTEQKLEGVASSSLVQNRHREAELGLRRDVHGLQAELREKKLHSENSIKELKLFLTNVPQTFLTHLFLNLLSSEMEAKFHQQMQSLITVEEKRRRAEVAELDDQMKSRIAVLIENQDRAVRGAEEYYTSVQNKLLADQNLMGSVCCAELSAAQQENRRLTEVLQEAEHKKQELQKRVQEHDEAEARRAVGSVERERDELLSRQTQAVLDLQQSSGLKEMLLQRKLAALTQTLQKKEAQLCAALSVCSTEPQARTSAASRLEVPDHTGPLLSTDTEPPHTDQTECVTVVLFAGSPAASAGVGPVAAAGLGSGLSGELSVSDRLGVASVQLTC